jgi:hypothetical protein
MPIRSNLDVVAADLRTLVDSLGLESPGESAATLADDLFDLQAQRIRDRSLAQRAPDGTTWADNEPRYAARKGYKPVGVGLTGEMLSLEQLRGDRRLGDESATMQYGKDAWNRQKAKWFSEGNDRGQPERPFWEITADDRDALDALARRHYDRIARYRGR